jgi:hypothetical protein
MDERRFRKDRIVCRGFVAVVCTCKQRYADDQESRSCDSIPSFLHSISVRILSRSVIGRRQRRIFGYAYIELPDHVFGAKARDGWTPLYNEKDALHETFVALGFLAAVTEG